MKRFWTDVAVTGDNPFGVALDGRAVRTPARDPLLLPTRVLAEAVADEWRDVTGEVKPAAMPLTGLANAALDLMAADVDGHALRLAEYAGSDLLCYRAEGPGPLVAKQAAAWDPVLAWAQQRFDTGFVVTAGVLPVTQPPMAVPRVAATLAALGPFGLAACAQLVPLSGSALLALALVEEAVDLDTAWAAATVDEAWSAENWGEDDDATAALALKAAAFAAAHRFLVLGRGRG
ncbi:chaperone required for assembly of F1-ATPase [Polymorphobacter multimanifer]|uniref:Chaperone required for assembly of F1-ATPase n=1 Tax=Polymorphobacter multimanifer TaxID=1070431 RepID=A0A841LGN9_9SPHN|nr:ATP12 family protein [Polymorphobacter multimanifer]MBB6228138.1 chaperone required for assembly of F1-ATPase [Polymorphobacter multimanifer]